MENKDLQTYRRDLQRLSKQKIIPPKMQVKLRYLEASICGEDIQSQYLNTLPQFEKQSLKLMNRQTQIELFKSIIKCFSGREAILYFQDQKVTIKKGQSFTSGSTYLISCDGNRVIAFKKKDKNSKPKQFLIEKLWVTKLYQLSKKKYTFGIVYDMNKYHFKFNEEGPCARIHGILLNLIRQKRSMLVNKLNQSRVRFGDQKQQKLVEKYQQQFEQIYDNENELLDEETEYFKKLKINVDQFSQQQESSKFQLIKNLNNGKIQGCKQKNSIRVLLFLEECSIKLLIQSYIIFGAWNLSVDTFKIISRLRTNTFLAYLKTKKYNLWTSPRDCYFTISYLKKCHCLFEDQSYRASIQSRKSFKCSSKHYIIIKTFQSDEFPAVAGVTRMKMDQMVELSQFEDKKGMVFMNLLSNIDFKSYQLFANNIDMSLSFMADIQSIMIYYKELEVHGDNTFLFQFDRCSCNIKNQKINSEVNYQIKNESHRSSERQIQIRGSPKSSKVNNQSGKEMDKKQIFLVIQDSLRFIKNQKILDILKEKIQERYYLKQKFDLSPKQEAFIKSNFRLDECSDFLLQGGKWKITPNDQYIFIDQQVIKLQKSILKVIIRQLTSNLLAGKSIMTMSLPVQIFDNTSAVQSITNIFGFVPKFMHEAVQTSDLIQQIKNVAIGFMFLWACDPKVNKPFNPILGQTFQGMIGGIPIYLEQISHHPPISTFFMKTDKFQAYGNFDISVDIGLNAAYSKIYGPFYVKIYHTNTQYVIKFADLELGGLMFGDRSMKAVGRGYVLEKKNNIYLQYSIGKQKKKLYEYNHKIKPSDLVGGVFKVKPQFITKILSIDKKKSVQGAKADDILQRYCKISGKWFGDIYFDQKPYKTVKNGPFPLRVERQPILLPSDCLFREDIVYKNWGDNNKSNQTKEILQNLQRRDRKLREKYSKEK